MKNGRSVLLPLLDELKTCPSRDNSFSAELLSEAWERFRQRELPVNKPILAIIGGLILDDPQFAELLNEAERSQIIALSKIALERFQQKTNPPNKIGKLIAASLKELI